MAPVDAMDALVPDAGHAQQGGDAMVPNTSTGPVYHDPVQRPGFGRPSHDMSGTEALVPDMGPLYSSPVGPQVDEALVPSTAQAGLTGRHDGLDAQVPCAVPMFEDATVPDAGPAITVPEAAVSPMPGGDLPRNSYNEVPSEGLHDLSAAQVYHKVQVHELVMSSLAQPNAHHHGGEQFQQIPSQQQYMSDHPDDMMDVMMADEEYLPPATADGFGQTYHSGGDFEVPSPEATLTGYHDMSGAAGFDTAFVPDVDLDGHPGHPSQFTDTGILFAPNESAEFDLVAHSTSKPPRLSDASTPLHHARTGSGAKSSNGGSAIDDVVLPVSPRLNDSVRSHESKRSLPSRASADDFTTLLGAEKLVCSLLNDVVDGVFQIVIPSSVPYDVDSDPRHSLKAFQNMSNDEITSRLEEWKCELDSQLIVFLETLEVELRSIHASLGTVSELSQERQDNIARRLDFMTQTQRHAQSFVQMELGDLLQGIFSGCFKEVLALHKVALDQDIDFCVQFMTPFVGMISPVSRLLEYIRQTHALAPAPSATPGNDDAIEDQDSRAAHAEAHAEEMADNAPCSDCSTTPTVTLHPRDSSVVSPEMAGQSSGRLLGSKIFSLYTEDVSRSSSPAVQTTCEWCDTPTDNSKEPCPHCGQITKFAVMMSASLEETGDSQFFTRSVSSDKPKQENLGRPSPMRRLMKRISGVFAGSSTNVNVPQAPPPAYLTCRICENEVPSMDLDQHSLLCAVIHKALLKHHLAEEQLKNFVRELHAMKDDAMTAADAEVDDDDSSDGETVKAKGASKNNPNRAAARAQKFALVARYEYLEAIAQTAVDAVNNIELITEHYGELKRQADDVAEDRHPAASDPSEVAAVSTPVELKRMAAGLAVVLEEVANTMTEYQTVVENHPTFVLGPVEIEDGGYDSDSSASGSITRHGSPKSSRNGKQSMWRRLFQGKGLKRSGSRQNLAPEDAASSGGMSRSSSMQGLAAASRLWPTIADFEMIKLISQGAYGRVYLARKIKTGDIFSVKVLRKPDMQRKNVCDAIMLERNIMAYNNTDFVVKLYFSFESRHYLYLVMEYLIGGDLSALLAHIGYCEEDMARQYIAETILAVEYLHSHGITHRDIKPDNLLLDHTGHIKLTDFGLSRLGVMQDSDSATTSLPPRPSTIGSESVSLPASPHVTVGEDLRKFSGADHGDGSVDDDGATTLVSSPTVGAAPDAAGRSNNSNNAPRSRRGSTIPGPRSRTQSFATTGRTSGDSQNGSVPLVPRGSGSSGGGATGTGMVGTPDYMAPEILLGHPHDHAVDWWAIGCMLFEFLTGMPPFTDDSPQAIFENILNRRIDWPEDPDFLSADAVDLLQKLLASNKAERLGTGGAQEVKNHPFFANINWETLKRRPAPFVPQPDDVTDTSYFDSRAQRYGDGTSSRGGTKYPSFRDGEDKRAIGHDDDAVNGTDLNVDSSQGVQFMYINFAHLDELNRELTDYHSRDIAGDLHEDDTRAPAPHFEAASH